MIGEQLGAWRIVRELGRGGMGAVWLAEHVELGHRVAIKVLLPELGRDPDQVARFVGEARAAARVRNPGIVQVHDIGRTPAGAPYLAMELLDGQTLRARLRARGALGFEEAATIARQVATTLAAAHAAGIVHRDLKPDNVMLVPDPEVPLGERAKVLDFGIAKLAEDRGGASVTRTGTVLGTPHYMAPEQCRGTGEVDARADVYALGCILFELVCGRPPFVSDGVGELVGMHQFVAPPSPRSLRADVPEALEAVILRALEKAPEERFGSMAELAAALEAIGAPAARASSVVEEPALDVTRESRDTDEAYADTIATGGRGDRAADVAVAATVIERPAGAADRAKVVAEAEAKARALAEAMARDEAGKRGGTGRVMTVVAVAVVMVGALALYVKLGRGDGGDEAGAPAVARAPKQEERPRPERADTSGVVGATGATGGEGGTGTGTGGGSGTGSGDGAGIGTGDGAGTGDPDPRVAEARDALARGDVTGASRLIAPVLRAAPADQDARAVAAEIACRLGDADAALAHLAVLDPPRRVEPIEACREVGIELAD